MIFKNEIKKSELSHFCAEYHCNQFSAHSREEKQSKHEMLRLFVCLAASPNRINRMATRREKHIAPIHFANIFDFVCRVTFETKKIAGGKDEKRMRRKKKKSRVRAFMSLFQ